MYNIQQREEHWRKFWEKEKIYRFDAKSKKPIFFVDTPPPYVSAEHLHAGHIMSYGQAEFIVRFKRMQGFNVFYPMGFDDNGLPTERFVEKKYNIDKSKIGRDEFIRKCLQETKQGIKNYKNLWDLLGISVDWSKTYSTIDKHCRAISQWSFIDLYKKGFLKRKKEPLFWCTSCGTALAQAELEIKQRKAILNYIQFKAQSGKPLLVATTRAELLPACVALFYNPQDRRYKGLKNKKAWVPLFNYEVPILSDESVDKNFGTGLMMVCTWGDKDDILKWKKYHLPTRAVLNEDGKLSSLAGKYQGQSVIQARRNIVYDLKQKGLIRGQEKIEQIIKVHERCNTPVEFIESRQWFISILSHQRDFLKRGRQMRWFPGYMRKKYEDWVNGLERDWCISRQRYYGVPFPVWYCKKCQHVVLAREKDLPVDPIVHRPSIKKCPKCGGKIFIPERDVMDTWMTSSLTPQIAAGLVKNKKAQKKLYPANLRPQSFEIIRSWLFYTVVKSHYHYNSVPFFDIMISGHGLDEKGRKISKRLGNFVPPEKIIDKYGADAVRYWATSARLGRNMRYSEQTVKKGKRTVIKLWNAAKFCISHFYPAMGPGNIDVARAHERGRVSRPVWPTNSIDKWIIHNLEMTIKNVTARFSVYQFSKARVYIDKFFWSDFCDNYLEAVKYRLYEKQISKSEKKSAFNTLYFCLLNIIRLYAPILPFITEEIYQKLSFANPQLSRIKSVHLQSWPKYDKNLTMKASEKKELDELFDIIAEIRRYKSEKGIPLGKEIESYSISNKEIFSKYKTQIEKIIRVKSIALKP